MKEKIQFILGIGFSIVLIYAILNFIDLEEFANQLTNANFSYIAFGILVYLLATFINAYRWRDILIANDFRKVSIFKLYKIITMSTMLNNTLPARMGEVSKGFFLMKNIKTTAGTAITTIVSERFFDLIVVLIFISIPLFGLGLLEQMQETFPLLINSVVELITRNYPNSESFFSPLKDINFSNFILIPIYIVIVLVITGIIFILIFRKNYSQMIKLLKKIIFWLPEDHSLFNKLNNFFADFKFFKHPQEVFEILLSSILLWMAYALSYYLIIKGFHLEIPYFLTFFIIGVTALGISIPSAPGGIGPFQIAFIVATALVIGINWADHLQTLLSCSIVLHLCHMLSISILGIIFFMLEHVSLKELNKSKEKID